jgi:hypothetical protein
MCILNVFLHGAIWTDDAEPEKNRELGNSYDSERTAACAKRLAGSDRRLVLGAGKHR